MSRYSNNDTYSQAGDWLLGAAHRNPEALLLLAAGCCLMMRGGGSSPSRAAFRSRSDRVAWDDQYGFDDASSRANRTSAEVRRASSETADRASRAAKTAAEYASQVKDRVADTASTYAETVSDFADDARRRVSEGSARLGRQAQSTLQSTMTRVLREQPLAVAAAGLAAGAAIAAVFPSTETEERAFGSTGEALREAAGKAGERVKDAAGKAGERLKEAAEERGLTSEGLKDLAGDVADTFTSAVSGKSDDRGGTTGAQGAAANPIGKGQGFGTEQGKREPDRSSGFAGTDIEPGRGGR
jgi:hypothetical protein